jgi:hypothetical protein
MKLLSVSYWSNGNISSFFDEGLILFSRIYNIVNFFNHDFITGDKKGMSAILSQLFMRDNKSFFKEINIKKSKRMDFFNELKKFRDIKDIPNDHKFKYTNKSGKKVKKIIKKWIKLYILKYRGEGYNEVLIMHPKIQAFFIKAKFEDITESIKEKARSLSLPIILIPPNEQNNKGIVDNIIRNILLKTNILQNLSYFDKLIKWIDLNKTNRKIIDINSIEKIIYAA